MGSRRIYSCIGRNLLKLYRNCVGGELHSENIVTMKSFLVVFAISIAFAQGAFCPGEKKHGKRCLAKENAYKCGAFFDDLLGNPDKPLQWLGALPDALKKVKTQEEIDEILTPGITKESFSNFQCDKVAANARCYTTLKKFQSEPLDSCKKNLVNTKGTGTIGDYLCGQVRRWLKNDDDFKANGKRDIKIGFQYSQCGEDWEPVSNGGVKLFANEPLCCTSDGFFERCNGDPYTKFCE